MRSKMDGSLTPHDIEKYYWYKTELQTLCRKYNLPVGGGKEELKQRLIQFLSTGKIESPRKVQAGKILKEEEIQLSTPLGTGYRTTQEARRFFLKRIGPHFKVMTEFIYWTRAHPEKTYGDAIIEWKKLSDELKSGKKRKIAPQFEYNQYTRDFFAENPGRSREDCIRCWKYKRSLAGPKIYETKDLIILKDHS